MAPIHTYMKHFNQWPDTLIDQHIANCGEFDIVDAGRHRRTPWTPARGGEWWMGLKSVDIDLILSNMLVGQWTVVRSVLDE